MDELIQRSFSGGLSDVEAGRLRSWRRASPENEIHYLEMLRLWELTSPRPCLVDRCRQARSNGC